MLVTSRCSGAGVFYSSIVQQSQLILKDKHYLNDKIMPGSWRAPESTWSPNYKLMHKTRQETPTRSWNTHNTSWRTPELSTTRLSQRTLRQQCLWVCSLQKQVPTMGEPTLLNVTPWECLHNICTATSWADQICFGSGKYLPDNWKWPWTDYRCRLWLRISITSMKLFSQWPTERCQRNDITQTEGSLYGVI